MQMDILTWIKQGIKKDFGISLIEIMASIAIMGIVMTGATRLFIGSMKAQAANRDLTIIESEVQDIVNQYRSMDYTQLLGLISSNRLSIVNGQTTNISIAGTESKANYILILTAVKTKDESFPESVILSVNVTQNTEVTKTSDFSYETIVSQVN